MRCHQSEVLGLLLGLKLSWVDFEGVSASFFATLQVDNIKEEEETKEWRWRKKILDSNLCRRASYRAGGSALMFILLLDCSRRLFNFRPAARKWPKAMHIDILLTSNKKALWALSFFACHPKQSVSSDPSIRGMRSLMMLSKTHPSLMSVKHEEDPYFLVATSHWSK